MPREEVPVMIQTLHGSYGSSSTEDRQRTRPVPTKLSRQQVVRSESSSSSSSPSTKSPNRISDKMDRRSPNNSERGSQKKRPIKLAEMEEELKKVKDELITSELSKKRIQQEAEEARKQLILLSEKLNETESQLAESSSLDDSRIFELRKLSQERDRAWQNELEAMQKQHSVDSVALATAMSEIFKLKGMVREREKERDVARKELEASRGTIDSILVDGSKLMDSFGAVVGELEESRVQIKMLEEKLSRIGKEESREIHGDVETLEIKLHEEEILSMVQWQCVVEIIKQIQIESKERETKLEEAANSAKSEIMLLKANLFDKDCEFRKILDQSKKKEAEAELNLNLTKLKENLEKKEKKLNQVLHENELLRAELTKLSTERQELCEQSIIEKKIAIEAQKEALSKLEIAIEEVKESKEKASIVNEKLDSVTNMKAEMETELRRLRVQADQWKKAAETAMTLLTVGSKDKLIERTNSYNSNSNLNLNLSNSVSGKFGSLDFPDELDDEPLSWKNGNVLRRISGMWKK
ncbi:interactor of constitutive active ROPs 3 isoform X1 [Carex littledalei]|uniref:Interactor of constitutive active ROPs 3 isoform X1 n=1 Tax=Carex littledalei TaxID=544730 RepID=A0A833VER5_9POAL|nr:interactor of constitutive active ROPs 3 isoform X1 [Carex littledalei]